MRSLFRSSPPFFPHPLRREELLRDQACLCHKLEQLLAQERQDPARLRLNQWLAFRELLERARSSVPGYQEKYRLAALRPEQLRGWEDLDRVPLLEKHEFRSGGPAHWEDPAATGEALDTRTSGSSGSPIHVRRDVDSLWLSTAQNMAVYHQWCSGRPISHALYFIDPSPHSVDHALARQLLATVDESRILSAFLPLEEQLEALLELAPAFVSSYPSTMKNLAQRLLESGLTLDSLRLLHLTSESLDDLGAAQLRRAFPQARLVQTYTATEAGLIAFQCGEGSGFHVATPRVLVEIVDAEGRPTQELGRVVITDLSNTHSPIIRYAGLEDFARWDEGPCACGRSGPRLAGLEGRRLESLRRGDGSLHPPYALTSAISALPGVAAYQVIQLELRRLQVRVVLEQRSAIPFTELETRLRAVLEEQLGTGLDCTVVREEEIRPEAGARKIPLIRCLLPEAP